MSGALPRHPAVDELDTYHAQLRDFFWDLLLPYRLVLDGDRWKEVRLCPHCKQPIYRSCQIEIRYTDGAPRLDERLIVDPPSGALIRERREKAELSIDALSRLSGVCQSTIRKVETGAKKATSRTIRRLVAVPQLGFLSETTPAPKRRPR